MKVMAIQPINSVQEDLESELDRGYNVTPGSTTRFAAKQRHEVIAEVNDGEFDLVVVGGGINGAGVAHDAALRGLKVLLLEQRDLAFELQVGRAN